MTIPIPSKKSRFRIRLGITAYDPFQLGIRAYDPTKPYTHYFRRRITFRPERFSSGQAYREIEIPMPLSPEVLALDLYDKHSGGDDMFHVDKFQIEKLPPVDIWAVPDMHDFIGFAQQFAEKAGYVKTGYYQSPDYRFLIHLLPRIKDQSGETLITPARTHRVTGRHQVSRELFRRFTVPVRFFILLHEREHYIIPTREERPADLSALQIYLDMGFPVIEAVYAATKVFRLHPETIGKKHAVRTRDIIQFIDDYKRS